MNKSIYYANLLVNFIALGSEKFKKEENGFDGFGVRAEFLKSRTNKAGQFVNLIYDQSTGFDPILTQLRFAEDNELIAGRNPYKYIEGVKDIKFDSRKFRKEFLTNEKLRYELFNRSLPILEKQLSHVEPEENGQLLNIFELCDRLEKSQEKQFQKAI